MTLSRLVRIDNRGTDDPYLNLALEEYLVRERRDGDFLLLYVDRPTVVIGKHQDICSEVGPIGLDARNGVGLVRRLSGGGTVYHDHGNINVSIVTDHHPPRHNRYDPFVAPVIATLERFGVTARLNGRNSLLLDDGRKISGNAQFASRGRMISHGTLLHSTNLERLSEAITSRFDVVATTGVPSIRSTVANLSEVLDPTTTIDELIEALEIAYTGSRSSMMTLDEREWDEIARLAREKYESWEWTFGRSPRTEVRHPGRGGTIITLVVDHGIVADVRIEQEPQGSVPVDPSLRSLIGRRFFEPGVGTVLDELDRTQQREEQK